MPYRTVVYCHDQDSKVKEIIENELGIIPTWIREEESYQFAALYKMFEFLYGFSLFKKSKYFRKVPSHKKILEKLEMKKYQEKLSLDEFQLEILKKLFTPNLNLEELGPKDKIPLALIVSCTNNRYPQLFNYLLMKRKLIKFVREKVMVKFYDPKSYF